MLPKLRPKLQAGYISWAVLIFMLLFSAIVYPYVFPYTSAGGCVVGKEPEESLTLELPGIKDLTNEPGVGKGGPSADKANFVLIRKDVPVYDGIYFWAENDNPPNEHAFKVNIPEHPEYVFYYPGQWNHFLFHRNVKPTNDTKNDPNNNNLAYRQEGLVVAVQTDESGNEKIVTAPNGMPARIADYFQIQEIVDAEKDYQTEELFHCTKELGEADTGVIVPVQDVSPGRDQLQLEWIKFGYGTALVYPHCKPAVYLYPERKQLVNVKVFPKGELSYTDPVYDSVSGWTVEAWPDGQLNNESRIMNHGKTQYDYLYYESKLWDSEIQKPSKGWVVELNHEAGIMNHGKYKDVKQLLDEILPKLGLNEKEAKDFKDYWLSKLPESPYYFVGLVEKEQRDYLETLSVTPKPDTSIRFSLFFEMLDQPISVEEPVIQTPKRNGFTLVDWGGMIKLHPGTPFTCSQ